MELSPWILYNDNQSALKGRPSYAWLSPLNPYFLFSFAFLLFLNFSFTSFTASRFHSHCFNFFFKYLREDFNPAVKSLSLAKNVVYIFLPSHLQQPLVVGFFGFFRLFFLFLLHFFFKFNFFFHFNCTIFNFVSSARESLLIFLIFIFTFFVSFLRIFSLLLFLICFGFIFTRLSCVKLLFFAFFL